MRDTDALERTWPWGRQACQDLMENAEMRSVAAFHCPDVDVFFLLLTFIE